jgi:hypothetical protein
MRKYDGEKLTADDAQAAILTTSYKEALEKVMPPSVRAARWADLAYAKETKVFHNEGQVVYSDPLDALHVQIRAMENISKQCGDYPDPSMSFKTPDGKSVTFEMHFGGEDADTEEG